MDERDACVLTDDGTCVPRTAMEQFEEIRRIDFTDEQWRWQDHVARIDFERVYRAGLHTRAGICSPLDIIHDIPAFAAGLGGITYAFPRSTRHDVQRARRRHRQLRRRALRSVGRLTYTLWLHPARWRDAWEAHHVRWAVEHGYDDC